MSLFAMKSIITAYQNFVFHSVWIDDPSGVIFGAFKAWK